MIPPLWFWTISIHYHSKKNNVEFRFAHLVVPTTFIHVGSASNLGHVFTNPKTMPHHPPKPLANNEVMNQVLRFWYHKWIIYHTPCPTTQGILRVISTLIFFISVNFFRPLTISGHLLMNGNEWELVEKKNIDKGGTFSNKIMSESNIIWDIPRLWALYNIPN